MAAWMLHAVCCGEEAGARNLVSFCVKWLQPAMKGTLCVRRVRLGSFGSFYVFCSNGCSCVHSSMALLEAVVADRIGMAAWMLHAVCCGEEAASRNRLFFRVKWLQPSMKGTSCLRRVRAGVVLVPTMLFCNNGSSIVRSCMRFLNLCSADRIVMAAWMLLGAAAACVILLSFAARSRKSYWSGCIQAAIVICQQMFAFLALLICLLKILLKSASKSSFFCSGVEIRFWSCYCRRCCA